MGLGDFLKALGAELFDILPPNVMKGPDGLAPAPGYEWISAAPFDLGVRWVPGLAWPERHLVTGEQQDTWRAAPGYRYVDPDTPNDYSVVWSPGRPWPERNLVASEREGGWRPAPGYSWQHPEVPGCLDVYWTPGKPHCNAPHVFAGDAPNRWLPEPGYAWVSDDVQDLRVVPDGPRARRMDQQRDRGPDLQRIRDLAMLGLDEEAARRDIDAAYRRLAKVHHPDRFATQAPDAREAANRSFLLIRAAYERLTRTA